MHILKPLFLGMKQGYVYCPEKIKVHFLRSLDADVAIMPETKIVLFVPLGQLGFVSWLSFGRHSVHCFQSRYHANGKLFFFFFFFPFSLCKNLRHYGYEAGVTVYRNWRWCDVCYFIPNENKIRRSQLKAAIACSSFKTLMCVQTCVTVYSISF